MHGGLEVGENPREEEIAKMLHHRRSLFRFLVGRCDAHTTAAPRKNKILPASIHVESSRRAKPPAMQRSRLENQNFVSSRSLIPSLSFGSHEISPPSPPPPSRAQILGMQVTIFRNETMRPRDET